MFLVSKTWFCFKGYLVMFENTIFLQVWEGFCSCFFNPFFLMLAFSFVGFSCFCIFLTSSCCCFINQVSMFWLLFLLFWVSLVLLCVIFWICFLFLVFGFCFFGGFKGQVRWPKGPPHLAPSSCCCFINQVSTFQIFVVSVVMGLSWFYYVLYFGFVFVLGFCLLEGLRVR